MAESRFRQRFDLPDDLIRAVKTRAAIDGVDLNHVVKAALEAYLTKELQLVRERAREVSSAQTVKRAGKAAGDGKS